VVPEAFAAPRVEGVKKQWTPACAGATAAMHAPSVAGNRAVHV
jgi:hypothetical protein